MKPSSEPTYQLNTLIDEPVPPYPFRLQKRDEKGTLMPGMLVTSPADLESYAQNDADHRAQIINGKLTLVSTVTEANLKSA